MLKESAFVMGKKKPREEKLKMKLLSGTAAI